MGKCEGALAALHLSTAAARRSGSRGLFFAFLLGRSVRIVGGQAPGAVEDGEMAVGVLVDPDLGLDVVAAVPVLGNLQGEPFVSHGVVAGDGALLLDAEDVVEVAGDNTVRPWPCNVRRTQL